MNYLKLRAMEYREKKALMNSIFKEYRKAKQVIAREFKSYPDVMYNKIKESNASYNKAESSLLKYLDQKQSAQELICKIDMVLSELSIDARRVIEHDFILQDKQAYWWEEYYSRSTYYRIKKDACLKVLFKLLC